MTDRRLECEALSDTRRGVRSAGVRSETSLSSRPPQHVDGSLRIEADEETVFHEEVE